MENSTEAPQKTKNRDFPGGSVVNNLPCNLGDVGWIPSLGTKIPHAKEQLSPWTASRESICLNEKYHMTQQRSLELQLRLNETK